MNLFEFFRMTIVTGNKVDIIGTVFREKRSIHFCDVQATIGNGRMAVDAGIPGIV